MEILSNQKLSISISEIYDEIQHKGYETQKLKYDKKANAYVAIAKSPDDEEIQGSGKNEKFALMQLLNNVSIHHARGIGKISRWKQTFESQLAQIAEAYSKAPSYEKKAASAWMELAAECKSRANVIQTHIQVSTTNHPEPYHSPDKMYDDVRKRRKLEVSLVAAENHPIWTTQQVINYRICLDVLGYTAANSDWGWEGTNKAFSAFASLLPELAQSALFSELIGQTAYATYYRAYGPIKICLLNKFIEKAQQEENPHKGYRGLHPSQMLIPGEVPEAKQKTAGIASDAEMVPVDWLKQYREYDRNPNSSYGEDSDPEYWNRLKNHIQQNCFEDPLTLDYDPDAGTGYLSEGNHRLGIAEELGLSHVPVHVYTSRERSNHPYQKITEPGQYLDKYGYFPQSAKPSYIGIPTSGQPYMPAQNSWYQDQHTSKKIEPTKDGTIPFDINDGWSSTLENIPTINYPTDFDDFLNLRDSGNVLDGLHTDWADYARDGYNTWGNWSEDTNKSLPEQSQQSIETQGTLAHKGYIPTDAFEIVPYGQFDPSSQPFQKTTQWNIINQDYQPLNSLNLNQNYHQPTLLEYSMLSVNDTKMFTEHGSTLSNYGNLQNTGDSMEVISAITPSTISKNYFQNDSNQIREEWRQYKQDNPEDALHITHSVANSIKAAFLLEDNTLGHGAIQYQSLLHKISDDPEELFKVINNARSEWNSERFGDETKEEHRPWTIPDKNGNIPLYSLANLLYEQDIDDPAEALKEAQRMIHQMLTRFHANVKNINKGKSKKDDKYEIGQKTEQAAIQQVMKWLSLVTDNNGKFDHWMPEHQAAKSVTIEPHKYDPSYDQHENHKVFNLQRYPAVHGKAIQMIAKLTKHLDRITEEALVDVHNHDGKGHHFRTFILSLENDINPKTVGFMWLLLAPYTSELSMIDEEMSKALGHNDSNTRDYWLKEREMIAHRDAMGLNHIPLGQFNLSLLNSNEDTKTSSTNHPLHQRLDAFRVDNPTPAWKVKLYGEQHPNYNFSLTQDVIKPIQEEWNHTVATQFAPDEIPTKKDRPPFTMISHDIASDIPASVYHLAPTEDRTRILQHGLMAADPTHNPMYNGTLEKSKSTFPEGLYAYPSLSRAQLSLAYRPNHDIWEIPTQGMQWYNDPDVMGAFYTQNNIPNTKLYQKNEDVVQWPSSNQPAEWMTDPGDLHNEYEENKDLWGIGRPDRVIGKVASKMQQYRDLGMSVQDVWDKIDEPIEKIAQMEWIVHEDK